MSISYKPDWNRVSKCGGYPAIYCPIHPRAWSTGYVHVHIIIAEQKIERLLTEDEIVHHKDENKMNYSPDNLEVFKSNSHHMIEHGKDRHQTMLDLTCAECDDMFQRRLGNEPAKRGAVNAFCSRRCNGRYNRRQQIANNKQQNRYTVIRHGTKTSYSYHKCRCDVCRSENTKRHREYRDRLNSK